MHINVQSMNANFNALKHEMSQRELDIIGISETWLKAVHCVENLEKYDLYRRQRLYANWKKQGGGVGIFVNRLYTSKMYKLECDEVIQLNSTLEVLAIKVKNGKKKAFIILCIYRPPSNNTEKTIEDIECMDMIIDELTKTKRLYMIMGDFNLNKPQLHKKLEAMIKKYGASQIIKNNTRGHAMLDLIITNQPHMCYNTKVENLHIADHLATFNNIQISKPAIQKIQITFKDYKTLINANISEKAHKMKSQVTACMDVNEAFNVFENEINELKATYVKTRTRIIKANGKMVKLSEVTKCNIKKRNDMYKDALRTGISEAWAKYKRIKKL